MNHGFVYCEHYVPSLLREYSELILVKNRLFKNILFFLNFTSGTFIMLIQLIVKLIECFLQITSSQKFMALNQTHLRIFGFSTKGLLTN